MCGIAGIIGNGRPVEATVVHAMTRSLEARGPDGEGFHISGEIGLGHRRLAVIDVDGGAQPLFSEDGAIVAVVNGEFYNFRQLRGQLENKGYRFKTRSDSEVLVHGYCEWGDDVLERLEGMFAFGLFDGGRRRLLLARDRMGEKPLFWAPLPGGGVAFASELRAFKHCPEVDLSVDAAALAQYLVFEYVPAPASMVKGVRKLEPGSKLVMCPGTVPEVSHYWDLPLVGGPQAPARHEPDLGRAARRLLVALRRSVHDRLESDVPLGIFLSGGIDSSTVAALASEQLGSELQTFSIDFGDPTFDETREARLVAASIGSRHFEERLSPRFLLELIPEIGALLDEPLGDGSLVPTHLLSRFARRHVTVALGGDGGDELLAGYPTFVAERLTNQIIDSAPDELGRLLVALGQRTLSLLPVSQRYLSPEFKLRQFLKGVNLSGGHRHQAWLGSLSPQESTRCLAPEVARELVQRPDSIIDARMSRCHAEHPWDRLLYFYVKGYLAESVLTKVDRASMAVGLEVRAPFLDRDVIRVACELSPHLRMRRLSSKHVLKHAVRGLIPERTIRRKKKGFGMPIGRWFQKELRPLLEEELAESRLRREGLFDPAEVRRMVDEHIEGVVDHRKPLWTLLAFQGWYHAWQR